MKRHTSTCRSSNVGQAQKHGENGQGDHRPLEHGGLGLGGLELKTQYLTIDSWWEESTTQRARLAGSGIPSRKTMATAAAAGSTQTHSFSNCASLLHQRAHFVNVQGPVVVLVAAAQFLLGRVEVPLVAAVALLQDGGQSCLPRRRRLLPPAASASPLRSTWLPCCVLMHSPIREKSKEEKQASAKRNKMNGERRKLEQSESDK